MSSELPGVSKDFFRAPGTRRFPQKATAPLKIGWTDKMCLSEGQKLCEWREIPVNEIAGHLTSFMNLWFAPDESDESDVPSTIRNVLLMMPRGLGISDELLLKDVFNSALETAESPTAMDDKKLMIKEPFLHHLNSKEKMEVLAFHGWLKRNLLQLKMLEKMISPGQSPSSEYNLVSQKLRAVLGFCALVSMRMTVKGEREIKRYFLHQASLTFHRLFPEAGLNVSFVAPASEFFAYAECVSNKSDTISGLLILLMFQYLKSVAKDDESSQLVKHILEESCLSVMAGNGMGLVTMFQDIKLIYPNLNNQQILSVVSDSSDDMSRELLLEFLDTYSQPDKPQYSWKWARVICHAYFRDLNIRENQRLCSKFAAVLLYTNPGIFEHKDLKQGNRFRESAIGWAKSFKTQLQIMNEKLERKS